MLQPDDDAPGLDDLIGVSRPQRDEAGDSAQRDELLDRLVRRTVLPEADRIMREDEQRVDLHDRSQPDRRLRIIRKNKEGRPERNQSSVCRHAVHCRAHAKFAHPKEHISPRRIHMKAHARLEDSLCRRRQIGLCPVALCQRNRERGALTVTKSVTGAIRNGA